MVKIKIFFAILLVIGLTGCMEEYPESGRYQKGSLELFSITQKAEIFSIESDDFSDWKELKHRIDNLKADESSILEMGEQLSKSELVKKTFSIVPFLSNHKFDFDAFLKARKEKREKQVVKLRTKVKKLSEEIDALQKIEKIAAAAKKTIEEKKAKLVAAKTQIKNKYHNLNDQANHILAQFNSKEYGFGQLNFPNHVGMVKLNTKKTDSCKKFIVGKNKYTKKNYRDYIFTEPVSIGKHKYCPYFLTPTNKSNKESLRKKLTDDNINTIREALIAYANNNKKVGEISAKLRFGLYNNNPELAVKVKKFDWSKRNKLSSLRNEYHDSTYQLNDLSSKSDNLDKKEALSDLYQLIKQAEPFYLYSELEKILKPVSKMQPDGVFKLNSNEKFHLIVIDPAMRNDPRNSLFALVRMEQYEGQKQVTINAESFFSFSQLGKIDL